MICVTRFIYRPPCVLVRTNTRLWLIDIIVRRETKAINMATEHIDDSAGPTVWTWVATVKFSVNERRCRRRSVYLFSKLLYGGGKKKSFFPPVKCLPVTPRSTPRTVRLGPFYRFFFLKFQFRAESTVSNRGNRFFSANDRVRVFSDYPNRNCHHSISIDKYPPLLGDTEIFWMSRNF